MIIIPENFFDWVPQKHGMHEDAFERTLKDYLRKHISKATEDSEFATKTNIHMIDLINAEERYDDVY